LTLSEHKSELKAINKKSNYLKQSSKMALEITDANFEEMVMKSDKPVLVDFWAEWCGPCRMVGPVVEEISKDYEGKAVVGKVDVDNNPMISAKFGIRNIPTILFLKNGVVVDKQVGAVPKSVLSGKLDAQLA
jgi:thioredoxin 1